ncbi:MAG: 30S ribosomal protein S3 [Acholeplasmataceae bacterium]|jgi:small subunit ribosomal protein S3
MGQKVNPIGLRIGIIRNWDSRWYADSKEVAELIKEDYLIRDHLMKVYHNGSVSHVEIERLKGKGKNRVRLRLHTAKPGVVIGRDAENKKKVETELERLTGKEIVLNVIEVKRPEANAQIVADSMARQLESRASFRRVQKIAIQRALRAGAKGVKTLVSGRLGGAEMARSEGYSEGRVPLHTLRADIDYATAEALTTYGILGVKVWIYHGEVLPGQTREDNQKKLEDRFSQQRGGARRGPRRQPKPQSREQGGE